MKKTLSIAIVVIAVILVSVLIFGTGFFAGRVTGGLAFFGPSRMMSRNNLYQGNSMMGNDCNSNLGWGSMMGNNRNFFSGTCVGNTTVAEPLSIDQAKQAVEAYLKNLGNTDLELEEIMIFDNNAYARIVEKSTGIGAMELLVDPSSQAVYPEYGPNMMWNLKYGHMGRLGGMMGGMMGRSQNNSNLIDATMSVTPEEALLAAQNYLDRELPGSVTADDADPFYGYYTIDILKDGKVTGMLSVNGFTGEVFFHSWHGIFIEESE